MCAYTNVLSLKVLAYRLISDVLENEAARWRQFEFD